MFDDRVKGFGRELINSTVGIGFHGETEKKEKGRGSTHRFYIVVENESEDNDQYDKESVIMNYFVSI